VVCPGHFCWRGIHATGWPGPGQLLAGTVGRVLQLVGTARAGRRGPRRKGPVEPQGDGLPWPGLRQQQALLAALEAPEQIAAAERAQVLITQGHGALQQWLTHPGQHPGEGPAAPSGREPPVRRNQPLLDLFDAA
jgi:hypothetical protein